MCLKLKYDGHKLDLVNISSVKSGGNRYNISANPQLTDGAERQHNLLLLEACTGSHTVRSTLTATAMCIVRWRNAIASTTASTNTIRSSWAIFCPPAIDALRRLGEQNSMFDSQLIQIEICAASTDWREIAGYFCWAGVEQAAEWAVHFECARGATYKWIPNNYIFAINDKDNMYFDFLFVTE